MEDWKKKYEEITKRVKELHESGNALTKLQMEVICPELAESEDERIRREIRNFLIDMECKESWLAYLEKQKELPFVKDVILGYPGHYFYDGERMHFCGNPAMEEKQKEHFRESC